MLTRASFRFLPFLAFLLSAACGGDDKDEHDKDPALAISATPATVSLGQGASTSVAVAITRSNLASADVALTVSGAPTGVTATVDPASTTAETATVNLTATQSAPVGDATMTVTASADGGLSATATIALTVTQPAPITVSGTLANAYGLGLGSAVVNVWGNGATAPVGTSTATDGTFSVQNIRPPYDVVFAIAGGSSRVYLGVTGSSMIYGHTNDNATRGSVTEMTGSLTPVEPGAKTLAFVNTAFYGTQATTDADATTYSLDVPNPTGAASINVSINALSFSADADGRPTAYHGFATRADVFSFDAPDFQNLTLMGPVASRTISVRARNANGAPVQSVGLGWVSDRVVPSITGITPTADITSLLIPNDPRIPVILQLTAENGKSAASLIQVIGATDTAYDLQLPRGLETVTPSDGAINITDSSSLSADSITGATYAFELLSAPQRLTVYSKSNTVSLARLRELGMGLVSTTSYQYYVFAIFTAGIDPYAPERLLLPQLARAQNAGFRVVQGYSFVTQ